MQKREFINRIWALYNIDGHLLPELNGQQRTEFLRDPLQYFLSTDEAQCDASMREVESRQAQVSGSSRTVFHPVNEKTLGARRLAGATDSKGKVSPSGREDLEGKQEQAKG